MKLNKIKYNDLNSRQKERYNFQKVSALLADYGFSCIKLDNDWASADFIAQHMNGTTFMKVQLKSRLTIDKKYIGKDIYIAFPDHGAWYLFNHDELLNIFLKNTTVGASDSWQRGGYSWPSISKNILDLLQPYKL